MAKLKELFRINADSKYNSAIEKFFVENDVDFTMVEESSVTHEYVILDRSGSKSGVIVTDKVVLPYDEEHQFLPIKLILSNGLSTVVGIEPSEYEKAVDTEHNKLPVSFETVSTNIGATDDMDSYEYNTAFINDFIKFMLPYKVSAESQEVILKFVEVALDACGDIRVGKTGTDGVTRDSVMSKLNDIATELRMK